MKRPQVLFISVAAYLSLCSETFPSDIPAPVSMPFRTNFAGAGGSFVPAFSGDGRYVVFVSQANNLVTNDNLAPYLDVLVRDLWANTTTLVSVNASGNGGGDGNSNYPTISSNGQRIAFSSEAENLTDHDANQVSDVFVRDMVSGVTVLVSVNAAGTGSAAGSPSSSRLRGSSRPVMTPDGRYVVFQSTATDLVANDTNQLSDLFIRDLEIGTTLLVSAGAEGSPVASADGSHSAAVTPDGKRVIFVSAATNLVPNVTNVLGEIYVRDVQPEVTRWISANVSSNFTDSTNGFGCFNPAISADGRFAAFKAWSFGVSNPVYLFYHDLDTELTTVITSNTWEFSWPAMSANGRFVAYEDSTNLYVWDSQSGSITLVSVNAFGDAPANGVSHTPVMTPDGATIAFLSTATDLVTNVTFLPGSGFQLFARNLATGSTRLVSARLDGNPSMAGLGGIVPAISSTGQAVAFDSPDSDLVPGDVNQAYDVFIRQVEAGTTQLVSERHSARVARTGTAPSRTAVNSISTDGRLVAFTTADNNLFPGDTNGLEDVFVRDLVSESILPVSVESTGQFRTNHVGRLPVISANGRYVLFHWQTNSGYYRFGDFNWLFRRDLLTQATEPVDDRPVSGLSSISTDGRLCAYGAHANIYLRDMNADTNQLLSLNRAGTSYGDDVSIDPIFSPDNNWVVFQSKARNLTSNSIPYGTTALYARDLTSNLTFLISRDQANSALSGFSTGAVFAASGRYLFFQNAYWTGAPSNVNSYVFNFQTRETPALACTNCLNLSPSAEGRILVFERKRQQSFFSTNDVWLKDLNTGQEKLLSVNRMGNGAGNGTSTSPLISGDGRFVVFVSKASDLVVHDTNNGADIFVHDRLQGYNMLISRNRQGIASGNGVSMKPVMAADGRTVIFESFASDLVEGDYNDTFDVFVLRLGAGDSDNDGMDDDWEAAYFGNLSQDGTADFDADGQSDLQEFIAGTDPTDTGSILRVLTVSSPHSGSTMILWSAVAGKSYLVQFKDALSTSAWSDLGEVVTATGSTASSVDETVGMQNQRFYRVLLVP